MEGNRSKWISEFEYPRPLQEVKVGDARGLYLNATIAYSYFRDVSPLYPELITESGRVSLLLHTVCPKNFFGRVYKLYRHKRDKREVFFIVIPKHLRSAIIMGKKRVMYNVKLLLDDSAHKVVHIELYGGI